MAARKSPAEKPLGIKSSPMLLHVPGVAGVDEAGRGPLAGPVVTAAVILPAGFDCAGVDDSKRLTAEARLEIAERIWAHAICEVEVAGHLEIDRLNILQATLAAMARAVSRLPAAKVLIDGNQLPKNLNREAEAVIKGDATYACIAAASILAKTTRDRIMTDMAAQYPGYGFERHFGYSTPEHLAALERLGPCEIHRRSFVRVRELDPAYVPEQPCLAL